MHLLKQMKTIVSKRRVYQVLAALMLTAAAIAYMSIRFSGMHSLHQASSLVEMSGALFVLALMYTVALAKCSHDLNLVSSNAESATGELKQAQKQQVALVKLSHSDYSREGKLLEAARELTEVLGNTLNVERASVWLTGEAGTIISCLDLYCRSTEDHTTPEFIKCNEHPNYFRALNRARTISVPDALTDKRTKEIRKGYLVPWNIHSTVDSSIRVGGKVVGYVFIGSVAEKRIWTADEVSFVAAVADQFAQTVANTEKHKTFETLKKVMLTTSGVTGEGFFDSLVCELCSVLKVEYSMVTEWFDESQGKMRSVSMGVGGQLGPGMEYKLAGTPCADVVRDGLVHIAEDAINRYPDDKDLARLDIESYMGARICDSEGQVIGVVNVFHTHKIEQPDTAKTLLEIFAARLAIEMERLKTLKTLEENQALLDATLNSTADGLLVTSNNGGVMMTNRRFGELWSIPEELVETGDDEKLLSFAVGQLQDPDAFIQRVRELNGSAADDFDVLRFKDGRVFERYSCPLKLEATVAGRVWSFRDITVKERTVASLQESEDRYHSIFDSSNDGFVIFDKDGRIKEANRATCRMHGWSEGEFIRLEPQEYVHKDSLATFREFLKRLGQGEDYQCVARDIRKDGSLIDVEVNGVRLPYLGEPHFLAVIRETTGRRRRERKNREMQEKLERAERMQSIGVLAGGVAHDLNNILGPLVAYPDLILMKLPEDSPLRGRIELIGNSAKHAAEVIQDLLTLARRGRVELQPNSLNGIVNDVLRSTNFVDLERSNPKVKLVIKMKPESVTISASKAHLTKAIFNLCANAYAVMPGGGELTIETFRMNLERLQSGHCIDQPGEYVGLKISDTGDGLTEEQIAKLFEPYYSKKSVIDSASGLGLAIVYGVIKDHGGYYDVTSELGKGTEFSVYLPAVSESIQPEYLKPSSYRGAETVLVVDDDQSQRDLACALLESLGYDVYSSSDGRSAIEILKTRPTDLVVLDMIMEDGFDGLDTYKAILDSNPYQKAVIVTGFAATERVEELLHLGAGACVKKPYSRDAIGKAVRETLDKVVSTVALKS